MTVLPNGCRYSAKRPSQGCLHSTSDSGLRSVEMPGHSHAVSAPVEAVGVLESKVGC